MGINFLVAPICALHLISMYHKLIHPYMMPVLMGLLGLGGLRTFEKTKGVAK
jgi:hypothetical protein